MNGAFRVLGVYRKEMGFEMLKLMLKFEVMRFYGCEIYS
jgi:hypothetical protein